MRSSLGPLAATAAALLGAHSALATISTTFPVGSSSCTGGQRCGPVKWQIDDSVSPPGKDFGETTVGIYTGSVNEQTLFLDLGTIDDPTDTLQIPAVEIPADAGPNGNFYFVRFQSVDAIDPDTGFPLQSFSAKFTLTGMTGKLSREAQAQIDGVSLGSSTKTVAAAKGNTDAASSAGASTSGASGALGAQSNAKVTSGAHKNSTSSDDKDGAAFKTSQSAGITVSLAAFMGMAAYLAL